MDKSWVSWTRENIERKCDPEGIFEILLKQKFHLAEIREAMGAGFPHNSKRLQTPLEILRKRESLALIQRSLAALNPKNKVVERRRYLSRAEFLEQYYAANRPVVLCDLMVNWKAVDRWTPDFLKATCADMMVEIQSERSKSDLYEIGSDAFRREVKFSDYVDMVFSTNESNDFYLTARNDFFKRPGAAALLDDIEMFPEFLKPNSSGDGLFLWFGPKGTVTPLHHDLLNIFMAQVTGRKLVKLIPSNELDLIYNHQGVYSQVDCLNPDNERFPKFQDATIMEVELAPGEVLFIPVGWWHHVVSLDTCITVSFTNFIFPNEFEWVHPQGENTHEQDGASSKSAEGGQSNSEITKVDHEALANFCASRLLKTPGAKQIEEPKAQLFVIDNFLSTEECNNLVQIINNEKLRPSTVTVYKEGFRTSYTSDLSELKHDLIDHIDEKIAATLGIKIAYSEGMQAQKYQVEQEFKAHTDYFQQGTEEYKEHASVKGNRTWTFMIYLTSVAKGGGTRFVNLDRTFTPKKGSAVVWNNLYRDGTPNPDTLHWGMPVKKGEKVIITKWFRERGDGTMFYDQ